jgi:hypothetical protein
VERRAACRLRPALPTTCQIRLPDDTVLARGQVYDLSATGVCLVIDRGWEPGEELGVLLVNAACTYALAMPLEVVRSSRLPTGHHSVAGRFRRALDPAELQPFLL